MLPPIAILGAVAAALLATALVDRRQLRRLRRELFELARSQRMNYSPVDRFGLAARLRAEGGWTTDATDLFVSDVLYAAGRDERRFVATARRRHTADARPARFVVVCVERLDDHAFREALPRREVMASSPVEAYREAIGASAGDGSAAPVIGETTPRTTRTS